MSKFNKAMEEIFDVAPIVNNNTNVIVQETVTNVEEINEKKLEEDLEEDYARVRNNYVEILETGKDAIMDMHKLASELEHPRAFEVLGGLIKNISEANEKFLAMHKTLKDIKGIKNAPASQHIQNAVFVGSTQELNALLKGKKKEDKNEINADAS